MLSARVLILLIALPPSALTQSATVKTSSPAPPASVPEPAVFTSNCVRFYPPAAIEAGMQGNTVLSIHLLPEGSVRNPRVVETSGHEELDRAAITCAGGLHLAPKTLKGAPLEVDEDIEVDWRISSFVHSAAPAGVSNICSYGHYPPMALREHAQGDTRLSFLVAGDGTVKDVVVTQSAGNFALDQASVDCVSHYHYRPATQNGTPVAYDAEVVIKWRLQF